MSLADLESFIGDAQVVYTYGVQRGADPQVKSAGVVCDGYRVIFNLG